MKLQCDKVERGQEHAGEAVETLCEEHVQL